MSKVVIAYHCYLYGDKYQDMVLKQIRLLMSSKLYQECDKLYIGVTTEPTMNPPNGIDWLRSLFEFKSSKNIPTIDSITEIVVYAENREETDTLMWIRDYAKANPDDYILYCHTKGITNQCPATEDWRHYMEYFTVEKWHDCVKKLKEGYDCCGVLWNKVTPLGNFPHFSGGFWWAKASHVNTLNATYLISNNRYYREFWIGSNPKARVYEFHNSHLNDKASLIVHKGHYDVRYPRDNYAITKTLHVISTAFERPIHLRRFIDTFLVQTCEKWTLSIVYDGKAPQEIKDIYTPYIPDTRISFTETPTLNGKYGHPNRKMMLQKLKGETTDFVLITNEDNMIVDSFVELFLKECKGNVGMVYCNTIHSYMKYDILSTQVKENFIDMGSFIVRLDIAQHVGFNHEHLSADGRYAVECYQECQRRGLIAVKINKALFCHN
jgi:hypothetical protein